MKKICEWTVGHGATGITYRLLSEEDNHNGYCINGRIIYSLERKSKDGLGGDRWDPVDDRITGGLAHILADAVDRLFYDKTK